MKLHDICTYVREYEAECLEAEYSDTGELWRIIQMFTNSIEGKDDD